ncbi:MAG: hypothetical protein Q9201_006490 [Fulgogasparrea decipioides]
MPLKLKPPTAPIQSQPEAPSPATSAKRKLTLTFGGASQPTPASSDVPTSATPAVKPKATRKPKADKPTRTSKPTAKKRDLETSILLDGDDEPKGNGIANVKRIKLVAKQSQPKRPPSPEDGFDRVKHVRLKFKGKIPERPIGVGYDSGSSDVEQDPALEEEFILRMQPGEDCEYLRKAIAERRWGTTAEGGADVRMQFLRQDGRRAIISIQKRLYAACLVDLPCVIEGMKSWDKKAWFKTADICQMLLVLGRITHENEALEYPLPKDVDPQTWQYAHGLTPPMRFARQRRFRKRISNRTIEAVEEEVERLLQADEACIQSGGDTKYEVTDNDGLTQAERDQAAREQEEDMAEYGGDDAEGDEDAEGEAEEGDDIENNYEPIDDNEQDDEADIAAALAAAMEADDQDAAPEPPPTTENASQQIPPIATPDSATAAETPLQPSFISSPSQAGTPAKESSGIDSGDDSASDSASDEDQADELDEASLEQQQERERQWAEINDLKAMIKSQEEKAAAQPNAILKSKILVNIKTIKRDLEVKLAALGVDEEDGEG